MLAQPAPPGNGDAVDDLRPRVYAADMRVSDRKIEALTDKLMGWLESQPDIEFLAPRHEIAHAIHEEFMDEKMLERELDEEVERILQQNEARIRQEGVDSWVMRKKIRQQLARERGIVL